MTPLVSIIIPTYNRAYLIAETLESICAQTYNKWECIVVDDHSDDNTETVVSDFIVKDPRIRFFKRPETKPKGANACRNHGLELSTGQYINWFDSDDIMNPDHLMVHLQCHLKTNVDAVVTNARTFVDSPENQVRDWSAIVPRNNLISEMIATEILWQTNCVTWKRESVPSNPFLEELVSSQEWTYHLSQLIDGVSFKIISQTTCLVREHEHRIGKLKSVKKTFSTFRSRHYIMEKFIKRGLLDGENEKGLLKFIFIALRQALQNRYYKVAVTILRYLVQSFARSKYKRQIAKIILVASPALVLSGKGEKLFKI